MTTKVSKITEVKHPIRAHLGIGFQEWRNVNEVVNKAIRDSQTWPEVLIALSVETGDLTGAKYSLAGAIFSERMFKRIRNVPDDAGLSYTSEPIKMNRIGDRCAEYPIYRTVQGLLTSEQLGLLNVSCNSVIGVGPHLCEKLGIVYSRLKDTNPIVLVCAGFICHSKGLLEAANGSRWILFNEIDPEWQGDDAARIKGFSVVEPVSTMVLSGVH